MASGRRKTAMEKSMGAENKSITTQLTAAARKSRELCKLQAFSIEHGAVQEEIERVRLEVERSQEELKRLAMKFEEFEARRQTIQNAIKNLGISRRNHSQR